MPRRKRGPFEGVANIVRFNWPMFVAGAGVTIFCLLGSAWTGWPAIVLIALLAAGLGTIVQTALSLAASHWVYDRSPLYDLSWLGRLLPSPPRKITNIHAGFDESSEILSEVFPDADLRIFDFYDPQRTTEPSIARARTAFPAALRAESIRVDSFPLCDESQDLILLFLAAHEIRRENERSAFFREIRRCLCPTGRLILVEHHRDLANFVAYGPGCLHFHARATWLKAIKQAGMTVISESRITPLVRVFECSSPS